MAKKGIILAGGTGTRLLPITKGVNKHLLPVYDKPMIYYPLTTLMLAGIKNILVITNPWDGTAFRALLGQGHKWGIHIGYAFQQKPGGIAEAITIAHKWLNGDGCALILGDNIFYGAGLGDILKDIKKPTIFTQWVHDPERYGVYDHGRIEEKPKRPRSNWAVTGLYFYDERVSRIAKGLKPSERGELEITDINNYYLRRKGMNVERLGRGFAWFDAGTAESLLQASNFIYTIQERQGVKIGDPHEIAKHMGYI